MKRAIVVVALAALSTVGALAVARASGSDAPLLTAVVGENDSYKLTFVDASTAAVTHLSPGAYTIDVSDDSAGHNLHLTGPGVDEATTVPGVGQSTWTVTLSNGFYRFFCDPHVPSMHGAFTVGTGRLPLTGAVGASGRVAMVNTFQLPPAKEPSGAYTITIHDRSAKDGFRLAGPGASRATGIAFRGTARWKLTLGPGTYTYRSVSHPARVHRFTVSGQPSWGS
jgi:plastocyanin